MMQGAKVKVAIDVDALGEQIAEMSAHIDAAMHRLLTAIRGATLPQAGMCKVHCHVHTG